MRHSVAGVILAGGLGTRLGHAKKAFIEIGGRTTLERLLAVYRPLFPEIRIAARDLDDFANVDVPVALDRFDARSSLTGIHAGLSAVDAPHAFFCACDTPFLQPELVTRLLAQLRPDDDVVIPLKPDGFREPLCAVYSTRCLPHIEAQLNRQDFKIIRFFPRVAVREVPLDILAPGDPSPRSFFNVNRPEDLEKAEALAEELGV